MKRSFVFIGWMTFVFIISFTSGAPLLFAKNLGVYGSTYPIAEEDLLTFIQHRLIALEKDGELKKLEKQFIQRSIQKTLRPTPVVGLTTTNVPQSFYIDPSFSVAHNIHDAEGHVIITKGTVINPLDRVTLHSVLVFFDADDPKQITWAKQIAEVLLKNSSSIMTAKFILVKGNVARVAKALNETVYFDQEGLISRKLHLKHIPCVVRQVEKRLQVQELSMDWIQNISPDTFYPTSSMAGRRNGL